MNLLGYTSTSKEFEIALEFALNDLKSYLIPVVFEILFKGNSGFFHLSEGFTAYEEEQEVLVQDGLTYRVTENLEQFNHQRNQKFRLIKLTYPA